MRHPETIKKYVNKTFPRFGINKKQQVTRLIYEVSHREKLPLSSIIKDIANEDLKFPNLKKYLIKRRFPNLTASTEPISPYLPQLDINPQYKVKIGKFKFNPKNIYIEEKAASSAIAKRFKQQFPKAKCINIPLLKEFIKNKRFNLLDYNKRTDNLFVVNERFDFFKPCPCTAKAISCGYHIFNLGMGCIYECTYCYLQEYANSPGIIIPANIDEFFSKFKQHKNNLRLGTGEFTDSLALDHITEFSPQLINFFRQHPQTIFEFKTKSNNIKNLLSVKSCKNVVIGFSLNPQIIINKNEFYSTSLLERLETAERCISAGFDVGFHFDPIICYTNWEKDYKQVVNMLFDKIPHKSIRWISLGTLRFSRKLKKIIENRFPQNDILDGELTLGFDGKMRYSDEIRIDIYKKMINFIKKRSKSVFLYLCMESKHTWKECK